MVIIACLFFLVALGAVAISIQSFREKGFLFNNAYIFASKEERERMDKKPYYRQSAVMFLAVAVAMSLIGVGILFENVWFVCVAILLAIIALVYVLVRDRAIENSKKH